MLALAKGRPGRLAAQAAVLTAVIGASVFYVSANKSVTLSVDGRTSQIHVLASTVEDLLDDQGVKVGARDIVAPAPATSLDEGDTVVVRYARPLTITVDGEKRTYWTTELSVDKALAALGVRADGAAMSASRSQRIERAGLSMWLSTPKRVTLVADGKKRKLTTVAPTVSALLSEQQPSVRPLDRLSAVPNAPLTDGLVVRLTRIEKQRVTKTEDVAYAVEKRKNSELYKGDTKVIKKGEAGSRTATYDLVLEDGKVTKRTLVDATVLSKPTTQVVEVGTKAKPTSGGNVGGDVDSLNWAALAECESGGNPNIVNPAGYYGLYQFSLPTWRSVGGSGKPTDYAAGEQTYRAKLLYKRTGASSWPSCGPRLFS